MQAVDQKIKKPRRNDEDNDKPLQALRHVPVPVMVLLEQEDIDCQW